MENVRGEKNISIVKTDRDLLHSHHRTILSQLGSNLNLAVSFTGKVLQDDSPELQVLVDSHEAGVYLPLLEI